MNHGVLLREGLVEVDLVSLANGTKSFPQATIKAQVSAFLCAAFDEHRADLDLLSGT